MHTPSRILDLPVPYRFVWLIGLVFTFLYVSQAYVTYLYRHSDNPFAWFFYVSTTATHFLTWVLLTPVLYRFSRLHSDGAVSSRAAIHLGLGLLVATVQSVGAAALRAVCYYLRDQEWMNIFDGHGLPSIIGSIFSGLVEYAVLIGTFIAIDTYRKYREKQVELVRMENELNNAVLHALKMQLHPHFLFNTLHSISSLMNEDIGKAQRVVTKLGFLLRSMLESKQSNLTPLKEELKYVRSYLDIEEIRFEDRLHVQYNIADGTLDCLVPSLILQPLVENALKHGLADQKENGVITLTSQESDGTLVLTVKDNGRGTADAKSSLEGGGVGLRNVRTRLEQMYAEHGRLVIESAIGNGFRAEITMPCEQAKGSS